LTRHDSRKPLDRVGSAVANKAMNRKATKWHP